jgi:hypothetical protein
MEHFGKSGGKFKPVVWLYLQSGQQRLAITDVQLFFQRHPTINSQPNCGQVQLENARLLNTALPINSEQ